MIIDFHTHIFPEKIINDRDNYCRRDLCFSTLYSNKKAKLVTIEQLINEMDDCNVDKSVVLNIGWNDNDICKETNDYILDSQSRYPERIFGFCAIKPDAGDIALKELERCIKNGARGIGEMRSDTGGFNLSSDGVINEIVDIMIRHRSILLLHSSEPVGHSYDGKGKVTPEILYPFILKYPELAIVCAHWGGGLPFYGLMPEVNKAMKNVYFDTAATPFLYKPEIIKHISEILGIDKILFGSDYPLMSPTRVISYIESSGINHRAQELILGKNAGYLLKIDRQNIFNDKG
jgi:predicted TIM-barrel fold metal-dependent hydrolase